MWDSESDEGEGDEAGAAEQFEVKARGEDDALYQEAAAFAEVSVGPCSDLRLPTLVAWQARLRQRCEGWDFPLPSWRSADAAALRAGLLGAHEKELQGDPDQRGAGDWAVVDDGQAVPARVGDVPPARARAARGRLSAVASRRARSSRRKRGKRAGAFRRAKRLAHRGKKGSDSLIESALGRCDVIEMHFGFCLFDFTNCSPNCGPCCCRPP